MSITVTVAVAREFSNPCYSGEDLNCHVPCAS